MLVITVDREIFVHKNIRLRFSHFIFVASAYRKCSALIIRN